ncbi:MAG TPA: phosphate acyltransferase [Candidatus Cloacimonas sp.]|jgi:phosphate butyryltransferase|nr:phosphate acyltransferase [Candidatus Cloacimonadota bacterium]HPV64219.1 phosphate acyltransferase [Candidatus Cloacimonas sp.]MDD3733563.1 phosphate acyltransferase [Candidatus Cloacimonadota bacterium]MDD4676579.1 phosphate acyltransferase [Candidatus Cloacimonadota bacterium]HRQ99680.1 phosphate acyltransferase [Candidatus Cloacimonas sp.]
MITKLTELAEKAINSGKKTRIAVAVAEDNNTINAILKATNNGFVSPILIGNKDKITALLPADIDSNKLQIMNITDPAMAVKEAVRMVRNNEADVLMKGLVGTETFLKAVLDKEKGLLPPKAVMSYTCALEIPKYHKLLFVSDTAVLINPDLNQKIAMINYSVAMARKFGIEKPKVALISATEKVSPSMPETLEYSLLCKMAERGQIKNCLVDGPLDIFLACDPTSLSIKGIQSSLEGDADILIFPNLESANSFYKGLMLFGEGELAGLICGTTKPVIVMSRSESENSKYYCIALSCLMAEGK